MEGMRLKDVAAQVASGEIDADDGARLLAAYDADTRTLVAEREHLRGEDVTVSAEPISR